MGHGNDGETSEFGIAMAALGRAAAGMRILRFRTAEAEYKDAMGQSVDSFFDMEREGDFLGVISWLFHVFICIFVFFIGLLLGYCTVGLLYCWAFGIFHVFVCNI